MSGAKRYPLPPAAECQHRPGSPIDLREDGEDAEIELHARRGSEAARLSRPNERPRLPVRPVREIREAFARVAAEMLPEPQEAIHSEGLRESRSLACFRDAPMSDRITGRNADDFAVLRSVANTARKNMLSVMEALSGSSESFLKAIGIEPRKSEPG